MFKVRVISPWLKELRAGDTLFSASLPAAEADALLCDWAPSDELFAFPRRKAWYCCEPQRQFAGLFGGQGEAVRAKLRPGEFLFHNHPDPRFRVPHVTHIEPPTVNRNADRLERAVAVVSNFGGAPFRRPFDLRLRNAFATHPDVDLYGRASWRRYRRGIFSFAGIPANHRGEIPGDWEESDKRNLMARYKVAVCLESAQEENYFTEKFVEAVQAGCIPVYRAHASVRAAFLQGARWIDPGDGAEGVDAVLRRALAGRREEYAEANAAWAATHPALAGTSVDRVFARIGACLRETP